jgi:hypothetical protein
MKLAAFFRSGDAGCPQTLDRMLEVQISRSWHTSHSFNCEGGAYGYVRTSDKFSSISLARESETGNRLLVAGVPLDLAGSLDARLNRIADSDFATAIQELQSLEGAFAAFLWHETERKFAVVTDILGMQPLYMYRSSGVLLLATEVKALMASRLIDLAMDPAGWGAFLSFRHLIGDRTLIQSVNRAPAATVLVYDPVRDDLNSSTYWSWPSPVHASRFEELPLDELMEAFYAELNAFGQHNSNATLCLSGGYDSRLILASLFKLGISPNTVSLSHADDMFDLDAKLAAHIARKFNAAFSLYHPNRDFFSSNGYKKYLVANEVATPSLYLFIAQLCDVIQPEMQAIWEGVFPGCILFPIHQPPGPFESYLQRECKRFEGDFWKAAELVFHPDILQQIREAFSECLERETRNYTDDEFGVSEFVVRNRTRHRIATNPMQVYCNDALPFTPGISKTFWSIAASIPYALRERHKLYQYIFERYFSRALTVPVVSGSTIYPLQAGRLQPDLLLARLGIFIKHNWRVNLVLSRLGIAQGDDFWNESALVSEAVRAIDSTDAHLNTDRVRKLQAAQDPLPYVSKRAKDLLFYWHFWRCLMQDGSTGAGTPLSCSLVGGRAE